MILAHTQHSKVSNSRIPRRHKVISVYMKNRNGSIAKSHKRKGIQIMREIFSTYIISLIHGKFL